MTLGSRHARVLAATGAFAAVEIALAASGRADHGFVCDDAFYYFQIARHVVDGRGFSFDGLHPTNGFHPLYAWLCVPIFALLRAPWPPVRVALALLGLATAATGYVLYRIGRALDDERAGELMALFFFLSPFVWILPLRGCEGGLSILCIALALWQAARMRRGDDGEALRLGALVGLACLARTENVFLAAGTGAWLAWRFRRGRALAAYAAAGALVVSPWLIWNLRNFGTIVQVSGAAKAAFGLYHPLPPIRGAGDLLGNLLDPFLHSMQFVAGEEFLPAERAPILVALSAAIVALALVAGGRRKPPVALAPIALLCAAHLAYYVFVQRSYFNWYFLPLALGGAILVGERLARARRAMVAALALASAAVCAVCLNGFAGRYPHLRHGAARELSPIFALLPRIPSGAHVGGWNVGRIGYFGSLYRPDLRFVNLDCVVNNALFDAYRNDRYDEWAKANVDWLIEPPLAPLRRELVEPVAGPLARIRRFK